ncbi:hypothetical protein [Pedobacter gandavensis]|uniref:Uncharacterized protein n=1 Tax=Pedobacter gandavensis TaxID=2679963 RepID=A0ABR6EVA9_9SPHI|nr:hypothetical protein [Pedobacter gandavensis]MBB2149184.1 hypothetical protein [Pedobacter gandavensis]
MEIINERGQILELSDRTSLSVERYNSLFNSSDKLLQDTIYPDKTGLTESNKVFIGNGHLVEISNDAYSLPVKIVVSGSTFFSGIMVYRITNNEISFELRVNFGSIANKLKTTNVRDIYTEDSYFPGTSSGTILPLMLDTAKNPNNYPYVFFPVWNDNWVDSASVVAANSPFVNAWDHNLQKFSGTTVNVPYWRLSYVISKIIEYLQFNVEGNYFTDPIEQEIYLFTLLGVFPRWNGILSSTSHLPDLMINEFLKQIIERKRISFDIDSFTNTVTIETAQSILSDPEFIDISDYIESIQEISVPEKKGYKITLKLNENDDSWNTGTSDKKVFQAPYILNVGSKENVIEMSVGTLRMKKDTLYTYPMNKELVKQTYFDNNWPLTLLRYKGMKNLSGGKVFPEATPLNLDLSDAEWYQFLNDSKPVTIIANIPPSILAKMKPSIKLRCISEQGIHFLVIPEKISYNLTPGITEFVQKVKIDARIVTTSYETKVDIEAVIPEQLVQEMFLVKFKAFWDPEVYDFQSLKIERIPEVGSTGVFGYTTIKYPTDEAGAGGSIGTTFATAGNRIDIEYRSEFRLYTDVKPRYYLRWGRKGTFTEKSGYYTFDRIAGVPWPEEGDKPIWIVF